MPLRKLIPLSIVCLFVTAFAAIGLAHPGHDAGDELSAKTASAASSTHPQAVPAGGKLSRGAVLVASLTVFVLAVFVGFEIIAKVPPTLHTPLMSGSNAISGITVVGAIIAAGHGGGGFAGLLGFVAVILANINVVGGFLVTHRMLLMFKKR